VLHPSISVRLDGSLPDPARRVVAAILHGDVHGGDGSIVEVRGVEPRSEAAVAAPSNTKHSRRGPWGNRTPRREVPRADLLRRRLRIGGPWRPVCLSGRSRPRWQVGQALATSPCSDAREVRWSLSGGDRPSVTVSVGGGVCLAWRASVEDRSRAVTLAPTVHRLRTIPRTGPCEPPDSALA